VACTSQVGLALESAFKKDICHLNDQGVAVCDCKLLKNYNTFLGIAIIAIILITLSFPIYCYTIINKNKPKGSLEDPTKRYNDKGELVDYTDKVGDHLTRTASMECLHIK